MIAILSLMFPSVLGLKFLIHLNKNISIKDEIIYYLLLVLFSNFICFGLIYLFKEINIDLVTYLNTYSFSAFKYIILSLLANIFMAFIITIFIKYFSFKLEVNNDSKNN